MFQAEPIQICPPLMTSADCVTSLLWYTGKYHIAMRNTRWGPVTGQCFDKTSEPYGALLWPDCCLCSTKLCFLSQNFWGSVFKQTCLCYWYCMYGAGGCERFTCKKSTGGRPEPGIRRSNFFFWEFLIKWDTKTMCTGHLTSFYGYGEWWSNFIFVSVT